MLLLAVMVIMPLAATLPVSAQASSQDPDRDEMRVLSAAINTEASAIQSAATAMTYTPIVAANGFPPFWAHTVGLRSYGTVVAVGDNYWGQCGVGVGITANFALCGDADSDGDVDVFD